MSRRSQRPFALIMILILVGNLILAGTPPLAVPKALASPSSSSVTCTPSTSSLSLGDSLTSSYEWVIRCRVYATNFTDTFKDHTGRTLSPPATSLSLLCPNRTSTLNLPLASYPLQNGTYTWISVVWMNITGYSSLHDKGNLHIRLTLDYFTIFDFSS